MITTHIRIRHISFYSLLKLNFISNTTCKKLANVQKYQYAILNTSNDKQRSIFSSEVDNEDNILFGYFIP